ncbi:MAG TPA: carbamoyltransferase HypF [Solirubrobacteraceae bacterium]|jgi:hydrogenase maturation protein HypF
MSARAATVEPSAPAVRRVRARVRGTVQGVGFRPYVYRLAGEHRLAGFVLNDADGVLLEVQGSAAEVERFLARLAVEAPPLAVVESVAAEERQPGAEERFAIRQSPRAGVAQAPVTPDSATCEDCVRELADPGDRRYRYPFVNCTNCGPRFSIVRGVPYDRAYTTMATFTMCARCRAEYEDPADRRFHAQPNACPRCGPSLALLSAEGVPPEPARVPVRGEDALRGAVEALRSGRIVAVKGIGGYHLACRGDDEAAVAALRARKHREDKPFALMVAGVRAAARLVRVGEAERALLRAVERPIVLAPRLPDAPVASSVASGATELGVMLPYSPLHHLLLGDLVDCPALVMTSANVSDEPIVFRDDDALERLGAIADLLLVHDRPIQTRTDDSLARVVQAPAGARVTLLRRSRGYVPASLPLADVTESPILACGAELKNTFCLAKGSRAWVSHHIGDLENYETLRSFTEGIAHFKALFDAEPAVLVHDLHPEYLSTKYAMECDVERLVGVQHHHAHLAACLAEHAERGSAVGAIYDGTGYGTDGTVWGGELLLGDLEGFRRVGALLAVPLPGGAAAIREPWRMACAWLAAAGDERERDPQIPRALRGRVPERSWQQVCRLLASGVRSPSTTSMGRLFDAVGALCGLRERVNYEGQAAIELEAACDPAERGAYPIALREQDERITIDPRETIAAILADLAAGTSLGAVATRFHGAIAAGTVQALSRAADASATELVVLCGGVFQNRRLLETTLAGLHTEGLRAIVPERLPLGDGAISYGQAAVAARRLAAPGPGAAPVPAQRPARAGA